MSVFLTADLKPFLGASYLPPDDRGGMLGFRSLLQRVDQLWTTDRPRALRAADTGARLMADMQVGGERPTAAVDVSALDNAFTAIGARRSIAPMAGSARRRSFHGRWCSPSCCATTREPGANRRST